jgi:hypothetical protein
MIGPSTVERIVELDRIVFPATQTADVIGARRFLAQRKEAATGARVMILLALHPSSPRLGLCADLAFCYAGPNFWFETNATYQAIIYLTSGGAFSDSGTATTFVYCGIGCSPSGYVGFMSETFDVSNGVQALAPTSTDQCKDGSWQGYAQFKNQGDCVSYVVTGK